MSVQKPEHLAKVELIGKDGNVFYLIAMCLRAARRAKYTKEQVDAFTAEVKSGDYDHALLVMQEWFEVS
jgi:hypothetical protein